MVADIAGDVLGTGTYAQVTSRKGKAVKTILHKNFESAIREVALVNACDHPNVIHIESVEISANNTKIHMKKYPCDLLTYMNSYGLLPVDTVYAITCGLIAGIAHVHSKGIIHGDIKPQNILMNTPEGSQPTPVICDFGIAVIGEEKYHTSRIQTCTYRAPEVDYDRARVQYSSSIDMWSLGCILLELATGTPANRYVNGNEDSSWYACTMLNVDHCQNRRQRLKLLRNLNVKYIREMVCDKLRHDPCRFDALMSSGYIQLIALCLHPNHNKRLDADSASALVNHLFNRTDVNNGIRVMSPVTPVDVDDMLCVVNVSYKVIGACHGSCLHLAEYLHSRYAACGGESCDETRHACVYIASCIFSGLTSIPDLITDTIAPHLIHKRVGEIIVALQGKIL